MEYIRGKENIQKVLKSGTKLTSDDFKNPTIEHFAYDKENIGTTFSPYVVINGNTFVRCMDDIDYECKMLRIIQ
ncbi:hypothetical protein AMYT_a0053 (plasmid) [Malaciobacter mytili LMG 24559]|uniref:hypothetical protein n=1 Tax=Malaciobacter mytili TaxID=603050 RepID=UPI000E107625|nr:hypothetical protein [Malaciobacter mytili]AXH16353.1 hypothetical protein AMYT_a0053 [Malaciobacter mytili LMG 24559]